MVKHSDLGATVVTHVPYRLDGKWGAFPWMGECRGCGWCDAYATPEEAAQACEDHLSRMKAKSG